MTGFVVIGLILALLAVSFVLYPVLRPQPARAGQPAASLERAERRHAIYRQILDIEFDQRVGKIADTDARDLSAALLREAADLLSTEPSTERGADPGADAEIEREIAAVRKALVASRAEELETAAR